MKEGIKSLVLIVCTDDKNGMMFNNRRQSRDALVIADLIQIVGQNKLYCSEYTAKLFDDFDFTPQICENFNNLSDSSYVFIENPDDIPKNITKIIKYLWNRHYPSDKKFNMNGFKLESSCEFSGKSHEKITREIYIKC